MKKLSQKNLERKLWKLCREIIIKKYGQVCFTCHKRIEGYNLQVGHFLPRSTCGAILKYDLRNLRPQCGYCNGFLGGYGAAYYDHLLQTEGKEYIAKLFMDKRKIVKAYDFWAEQLKAYKKDYKKLI